MKKEKTEKKTLENAKRLRREQTPQETILWSRLRNRRLDGMKFRRQYPIGKYIVDFVCLERKLIIELDGWQHGVGGGLKRDEERTQLLESEGYEVLRFWNNDVNGNLEGVLLKIQERLR
ncbi:MAG: endonuclease domain-containing protein [Candidatus Moranbacteria bacterium]|nr:endonuclease domain-containing protein [Candidatus Moranbacteria bacterium]